MPHAFQVLQALCRRIISGLCFWYVDSLMAVYQRFNHSQQSSATFIWE